MTFKTKLVAVNAVWLATAGPALAQEDPSARGPYATTVAEYGSYSTLITLRDIPNIEFHGRVSYPQDLTGGPFPLVLMLHGWHPTCYTLSTEEGAYNWPCDSATQSPIPSYRGYDYVADVLASHGMIVASISANGITARDNELIYLGMPERAFLIQQHLANWASFNSGGGPPFGTNFVGKVDLGRVGTMGHSRGGEGVIFHYNHNKALGAPYGVRAVFAVAPTNFHKRVVNGMPLGVLMGYCDGDVYPLPGGSYLDNSRYNDPGDNAPKYTVMALGANHNFFNSVWTPDQYSRASVDDWLLLEDGFRDENPGFTADPFCNPVYGTGRITSAQQRAVGTVYMAAFFRRYLLGATQFDGILKAEVPPPSSVGLSGIGRGYHPGAYDRRDLNRLDQASNLTENDLGGRVTSESLSNFSQCGYLLMNDCAEGGVSVRETLDWRFHDLTLLELGWAARGGFYRNEIPAGQRDVTNFSSLQFRAAVNFADPLNPVGTSQDFRIQLVDAAGRIASVRASDYMGVLYYPPGTPGLKALVMNTGRIPLRAFAGIDLTSVAFVDFVFNQEPSGDVLFSDIAFADEGISLAELIAVTAPG